MIQSDNKWLTICGTIAGLLAIGYLVVFVVQRTPSW